MLEAGILAGLLFSPLSGLLGAPRSPELATVVTGFYLASLLSEKFNPGFETIEARLFTEAEVPWDEIAFRTVKETLEAYFADRKAGAFGLHCVDIE